MVFTVRESEKEATPIGKNQAGIFSGSFRSKLNSATKLNDVTVGEEGVGVGGRNLFPH